MLNKFWRLIFKNKNQRTLEKLSVYLEKVNNLEKSFTKLSDQELSSQTGELKNLYARKVPLEQILPSAFATIREVSLRKLGMRPFDVQIIGGIVLNQGKIAEMSTGEGKTLVATLPAYLNALSGKNVHIVTVNSYLAKRDALWMSPIFNFLGLSVGVISSDMSVAEKRQAYSSDIVYGTSNEFGFDYLRDNMVLNFNDKKQGYLNFAIVDEVDSILIDEARTPLIISGSVDEDSSIYLKIKDIIPKLSEDKKSDGSGDYYLEEKNRQAYFTEQGHKKMENSLIEKGILGKGESLYDAKNIRLIHYINASLRAHNLFFNNIDYIVSNGEILIVDEHTGRTMANRRWSDGLHQAIEAKEGVEIRDENQTLASITFQNYFRLYNKLSGMTGTADTEAFEFQQIYGLEVVVIPTNKPLIRKDHPDKIYLTKEQKRAAAILDIKENIKLNRPILVGTASIESSEDLSHQLKKEKIAHTILNAKYHEQEAEIIAQAGKANAVTIATNMAGRGTDIILGGNPDLEMKKIDPQDQTKIANIKNRWQKNNQRVVAAGGLHVIGYERHNSRRIDNQLRGRCARQGDPGSSRFYISLEDDLMRIFAADRASKLIKILGFKEDCAIEHDMITKSIAKAQKKVENFHFEMRKQLLEYDDVANFQRKIIYAQRDEIMQSPDISGNIKSFFESVVETEIDDYIPVQGFIEIGKLKELEKKFFAEFNTTIDLVNKREENEDISEEDLYKLIIKKIIKQYDEKEKILGSQFMRQFEKSITLSVLDSCWQKHLRLMEHLRQTIHFRGYAHKNPKHEYKKEAYTLFNETLYNIKYEVVKLITTIRIEERDAGIVELERQKRISEQRKIQFMQDSNEKRADKSLTIVRSKRKIGRNDLCPCGSKKKYKYCHGKF